MKRFSKNVLSITGSDVARSLLGFLTVAYLARKVGTAGFGVINIGLTVFAYALMVSSAGLNAFGTRTIARGEGETVFNAILSLRLVGGAAAYLVVAAIAVFLIPNPVTSLFILIVCASLIVQVFTIDWYFQGKEAMWIIGVSRVCSAALYLLLVIWFIHSPADIAWVALAAVAGDVCSASVLWIARRRRDGKSPFRFTSAAWPALLGQALPMGVGYILANISVNLPTIVLGIVRTNEAAGIYGAASKLVTALMMFDRVAGYLLLPASSRLNVGGGERLPAALAEALRWIVVGALPLCVGGCLLADKLVPLIFGGQYTDSIPVFRILVWFFLWTMIHTVYSSGLIAIGQERIFSRVMVMSSAIYFTTIIAGTIVAGPAGAAAGVVLSEMVTLLIMRSRMERFVAVPIHPSLLTAALAAILMGIALLILPTGGAATSIAAGAAIYILLLGAFRSVTMRDVSGLLARIQ